MADEKKDQNTEVVDIFKYTENGERWVKMKETHYRQMLKELSKPLFRTVE